MFTRQNRKIKFEDEKIAYAFVQAAVKHALAQFSVMPTLDFDLDASIQQLPSIQQPFTKDRQSAATSTQIFKGFTEKHQAHFIEKPNKGELKHWKDFYDGHEKEEVKKHASRQKEESNQYAEESNFSYKGSLLNTHHLPQHTQLHNAYILTETNNGFILINQQLAHERIYTNN